MKKIIKYISIFLILLLLFNFLLLLSSLFPSTLIESNVRESSSTLSKEGNYYKILPYSSVINDNYTDALIINEAYSIDNSNPIYSYMTVRKNYKNNITTTSLKDINGELSSINSDDYNPVR